MGAARAAGRRAGDRPRRRTSRWRPSAACAGPRDRAGALVLRPAAGQARQFAAHLAALQWTRPGPPLGFCLGEDLLTTVAAVWRGDPARVPEAQRELLTRLRTTAALARAARRESHRRRPSALWSQNAEGPGP
ncbi:hypothetical protein BJF78_26080 [Pseudonocardia sp. CNS-139]|nr:hypothetical protein BJF78_26080 [Pseudonocardia sp. CNS-139]